MSNNRKPAPIDKILVLDCETSGLFMNSPYPPRDISPNATGDYYQTVSWGFLVVETNTLSVVESKYIEIQWDGKSLWNAGAERVHGLSKDYLYENGLTEEDAAIEIAELILKYWGPEGNVVCAGHNVGVFDLAFLRDMMMRHEIPIRLSNRTIDTFSLGYTCLRAINSDQLFELCGLEARNAHNALEDAMMTLIAIQTIRGAFDSML